LGSKKINNPAYFEDLKPVQSLHKIGGVGIELWTMTEDILFDNIYVGHDVDAAKEFAKETYQQKSALESAAAKAAKEAARKSAGLDDEDDVDFKADPVGFVRQKVFNFIDLAKIDPALAFKTHPETGVGLAAAAITLFGMIAALLGLIGGQQKPITKSTKKTDAPTKDDKKTEAAPVAPAGGNKTEETSVKKRK